MKQPTFESYLQDIHMEDYIGTDDDALDAYEAWLTDVPFEEIISYADSFGKQEYERGRKDMANESQLLASAPN